MSRTLRTIAYNLQDNELEKTDGYDAILEQTRDAISRDHADELAAVISDDKAGNTVKRLIADFVDIRHLHSPGLDMKQLVERLYGDMAGFGFLDKYIHDPSIEEINGNSWNDIELVTTEGVFKIDEHFSSPQRAVDMIRKMARLGGIMLDNTSPMVDSYLSRGIRISAIIPPCVDRDTGVVFSLRRQRIVKICREEFIDKGTATGEMLDFLSLCINYGISMGLAGATSSGKTTGINYLLGTVDNNKRMYIIEETAELDARKYDENGNPLNRVIQTLTRESNMEGANVDMSDALRKSLRFHPDFIVVSEMRGGEAMIAQEAARTGHPVITSLHANSARKAYLRILSMCQMSGTTLPAHILMGMIIEAFPLMVFMKQLRDGSRRIMEIIEATSSWDGDIHANTLYRYAMKSDGKGAHEKVCGISDALAETMLENGANSATVESYRAGQPPQIQVDNKTNRKR